MQGRIEEDRKMGRKRGGESDLQPMSPASESMGSWALTYATIS